MLPVTRVRRARPWTGGQRGQTARRRRHPRGFCSACRTSASQTAPACSRRPPPRRGTPAAVPDHPLTGDAPVQRRIPYRQCYARVRSHEQRGEWSWHGWRLMAVPRPSQLQTPSFLRGGGPPPPPVRQRRAGWISPHYSPAGRYRSSARRGRGGPARREGPRWAPAGGRRRRPPLRAALLPPDGERSRARPRVPAGRPPPPPLLAPPAVGIGPRGAAGPGRPSPPRGRLTPPLPDASSCCRGSDKVLGRRAAPALLREGVATLTTTLARAAAPAAARSPRRRRGATGRPHPAQTTVSVVVMCPPSRVRVRVGGAAAGRRVSGPWRR